MLVANVILAVTTAVICLSVNSLVVVSDCCATCSHPSKRTVHESWGEARGLRGAIFSSALETLLGLALESVRQEEDGVVFVGLASDRMLSRQGTLAMKEMILRQFSCHFSSWLVPFHCVELYRSIS